MASDPFGYLALSLLSCKRILRWLQRVLRGGAGRLLSAQLFVAFLLCPGNIFGELAGSMPMKKFRLLSHRERVVRTLNAS